MYSKHVDFSTLVSQVEHYIRDHRLTLSESDYTFLDRLLEDAHMQRILSVWLVNNNATQLNYLFKKTLPALSDMQPAIQESALSHMLQRAKKVSDMIPTPTDLDVVLDSLGEESWNTWQGWADFNRPLFVCGDQDIAQLEKYNFFINNGLFTANTVLAMSDQDMAAFDARVDAVIVENADFVYPDRIFSDKLINLLKNDLIMQRILSNIQIEETTKWSAEDDLNKTTKLPGSPVTDVEDQSVHDLDYYLGLDDTDSDVEEERQQVQDSPLSDITQEGFDNTDVPTTPSSEQSTIVGPTFWQMFNIQLYNLEKLIRHRQLTLKDIPDRELTEQEKTVFSMMNRLLQDLGGEDFDNDNSVHTVPEPYMTQARSQPQRHMQTPVASHSIQRKMGTTSYEDWLAAKRNAVPAQQTSKREFYAGIKEPTHNARLNRHINEEKRVQADRLAREPKGMPNWHKQYMEMLRKREKGASEDSTLHSGVKSKFGKSGI